MGSPDDNANWVFDYGLIDDVLPVPGVDFHALDPPAPLWSPSSHSFTNTASFSPLFFGIQFDDSLDNSDGLKENGPQKRLRPGSGNTPAPGSKACREKRRRDRLNDRFMELSALLDPVRSPKLDKSAILVDAVRMVTQLRNEAQKLKASNKSLRRKINELKAEKNELCDEKQRLKVEKENMEKQVRELSASWHYPPDPPTFPAPFSAPPDQVVGNKLVPFVGYPGVFMWQLMPPSAVDISQDGDLHPPVA